MTVSDLRLAIRTDLRRALTNDGIVTDAVILSTLNQSYEWLSALTQALRMTVYMAGVSGLREYSLPPGAFRAWNVRYDTVTTLLPRATVWELDAYIPGWRSTAAGTPVQWYEPDERVIGLYPAPSIAGGLTKLVTLECGAVPVIAASAVRSLTFTAATTLAAVGDTIAQVNPPVAPMATVYQVHLATLVGGIGTGTYFVNNQTGTFVAGPLLVGAVNKGTASGDSTIFPGTVLTLVNDNDTPLIRAAYHQILQHDTVERLLSGLIAVDEGAEPRRAMAEAKRNELLARFMADVDSAGRTQKRPQVGQ